MFCSTTSETSSLYAQAFGGLVAKGLGRAVASGNGPLEGSSSQRKVQVVEDGVSHVRKYDGANPQSDPDVGAPDHRRFRNHQRPETNGRSQ